MSNKKIVKLAVLRSDDSNNKCPFGLSIPSACNNVGETIDKMFPIDNTGLSGEEIEQVKKSNNFLARWQSTGQKCKYAGQIIKHDVNCNFGENDAGIDIEKAPFAAPFYPKVYNNTAYDGVFTAPIGYYADYDLMRNSYYGMYSLQGNLENNELNKFAGKVDDLKKKYPELSSDIEEMSSQDPSRSNKYLEWMVKQFKDGFKKSDIIPTIQLFHKHIDKLEKKDIKQYNTVKDLEDTLKNINLTSKTEQKKQQKENGKKVYEDESYVLIRPDDKQACIAYGRNTKWCITMENASYYEQYKMDNVVFYFLINKNPTNDPQDKIAFALLRNSDNKFVGFEMYDAQDNLINSTDVKLSDDLFYKILEIVKNDQATIPKSLLAKLSSSENLTEQEVDEIINSDSEEARIKAAELLNKKYLYKMVKDPSIYVRQIVAERIPEEQLSLMMYDTTDAVLKIVVENINPRYLIDIADNCSVRVLVEIYGRVGDHNLHIKNSPLLQKTIKNSSLWEDILMANHLRHYLINRIDRDELIYFINDPVDLNRRRVAHLISYKYLPEMYKNEKNTHNDKFIIEILEERMNELGLLENEEK